MTRALGGARAAEAAAPPWRVREERDRRTLLSLLDADRGYAAFAVGHLDGELFGDARYWTAEGPSGERAVVMHAGGRLGRMSVIAGAPAGAAAALSLHPGPRRGYLGACAPEHLPAVRRVHDLGGLLTMRRMTVSASAFAPAPAPGGVRRLRGGDAPALNALYASGGGPTGYRREHLEQGVYYGAFGGGELVAAAGTHLVAPGAGVAVVGNVFTREDRRGQGLATRATSAVTAELLGRGCRLVALTVDPANAPAIRAYERLGYRPGAALHEARFRRRDATGLGAALRRWSARRGSGGEFLVRPPRAAGAAPDGGGSA